MEKNNRHYPVYLLLSAIFTACNALSGLLAIIPAIDGLVFLPFQLLIIGSGFDFLDGMFARKAGIESSAGILVDTSADAITFVVLPAVIMMNAFQYLGTGTGLLAPLAVLLPLFYISCGLFRLIRFVKRGEKKLFEGLPTVVAALVVGSFCILVITVPVELEFLIKNSLLLAVVMTCTSLLMVSTFQYPSHKRGARRDYLLLGLADVFIVIFVLFPGFLTVMGILLVSLLYSVTGPLYSLRSAG
ncbi:MAG: CDP-alcohol phosphatidyltransferase family protein [Candidatus Hodarchaeales archaeon]